MFRLVKILNGRINVSEPIHLKQPSTVTLAEGTAVHHDSTGKLIAATGENAAEYVVAQSVTGATTVPVILITPDMIFETDAVTGASVGKKYQLSAGTAFTTTAGTAVTVIETGPDYALVRLA